MKADPIFDQYLVKDDDGKRTYASFSFFSDRFLQDWSPGNQSKATWRCSWIWAPPLKITERYAECDSTVEKGLKLKVESTRRAIKVILPCKREGKRLPSHSFGGSTSTQKDYLNLHC